MLLLTSDGYMLQAETKATAELAESVSLVFDWFPCCENTQPFLIHERLFWKRGLFIRETKLSKMKRIERVRLNPEYSMYNN